MKLQRQQTQWKTQKAMILGIILTTIMTVTGCGSSNQGPTLTQVSTIDALLSGVYDGSMSLAELKQHGNFGIGTFDALDGEMLLLDGTIYQVRADGSVHTPATGTTPFASVCQFTPDEITTQTPTTYPALQKSLDTTYPNMNLFYAFKITGIFSHMKTRSVPAQKKPFPPLAEVTKNQPMFERANVRGTLVGFRCPPYIKGVNVPGYHLHFLSEDGTFGGHVLEFDLTSGTLSVSTIHDVHLVLPKNSPAFGSADLNKDRSLELKKVEQ